MPRYKAMCSCKTEFWVIKTCKLDELQKQQLQRRSLCAACADIYRKRFRDVRSQSFSGPVNEQEQKELDSLLTRLKANSPWGFEKKPFQSALRDQIEEDRKTISEGIETRYRGYSPTHEMLRLRYRLLVGEWALQQTL